MVQLGVHLKTQKLVAVKILKKAAMSPEETSLIRVEIEILKLCQHPNIIRLFDVFENHRYIFMVMEYLPGGDLFSFLTKSQFRISEKYAAKIMCSLSAAIFYLHSYGIIHRDLKPENILLLDKNDESDVKITDFGLAKIMGANERCTDPFGTLGYVAPEVMCKIPYGKEVDIWSLGVVGYLLLHGNLPFEECKDTEQNIAK